MNIAASIAFDSAVRLSFGAAVRAASFSLLLLFLGCGPHTDVQDPPDANDGGSSLSDGGLSRCTQSATALHCAHHTLSISPGGLGLGDRSVHWQVPVGVAPAAGWPVVFMFQGSFFSANTFWDVTPELPHGGWAQGHVTRALLDSGFAVITPKTRADGSTFWDTNLWAFASDWTSSDDHHLMLQIFDGIAAGRYGKLDPKRWYATGISSGGYMTSRMAVSYPGKFRALAVVSGSYATCGGELCSVPTPLPSDHPPTLFLHGEKDGTVPISTMRLYRDVLEQQKIQNRVVTDPEAGHWWLAVSPAEVTGWFANH